MAFIPPELYRYIRVQLPLKEAHRFREVRKDMRSFEKWELERLYLGKKLRDSVKYLVSQGVTIHEEINYCLTLAAGDGHLEVLRVLIENGGDINARNNKALRSAVASGYLEIVHFLVEHGADVNAENIPLLLAAEHGDFEVFDYIQTKRKINNY